MDNYLLKQDEYVLFDDTVFLQGSKDINHLTLTNQNLIIVTTQRKIFKMGESEVTIFPVSEIKVYNDIPQAKQKFETVVVYLTSCELTFRFINVIKATNFANKLHELITGKSFASRSAGKVKGAIGLVDDTLGINTMGTIAGALENGLGGSILKGFSGKDEKSDNRLGKIGKIGAVLNGASAVVQAVNNNSINDTEQVESANDLTYEQRIDTVKKLKELVDIGILSEEEFDLKKKELLSL